MGLSLLSQDAWSVVCHFIDGRDVLCLILCGNAQLTSKIKASCESFDLKTRPFTAFPFSAFSLPRLAHLSVYLDERSRFMPLRLNHQLPLPAQAVPSLTSLRLAFAQSCAVLRLDASPSPLERCFPHLQHLVLEQATRIWSDEYILALPQTLLSLKIRLFAFLTDSPPDPTIAYTIFAHLPKGLESLEIAPTEVMPSPKTGRFENLVFPPALRKLILQVRSAHILHHLPRHLEYLDLIIAQRDGVSIRAQELPSTLKHCAVEFTDYTEAAIVADGPFPKGLELFRATLAMESADLFDYFPPTITDILFQMDLLFAHPSKIARFPRLKSFAVYVPNPAELLQTPLPKTLTSLFVSNVSPDLIPWTSLPQTLKTVMLQVDSTERMRALPRGLASLGLSYRCATALSPESFEAMPQQLESLTMCLQHLSSADCLDRLPASLTSLNLTTGSRPNPEIALDTKIPTHMSHLKAMRSFEVGYSEPAVWREWVTEFGEVFPKLEEFMVTHSWSEGEQHIPSDYLKRLPKSLRVFRAPLMRLDEKDPDILAMLPPQLCELKFWSIHADYRPIATDEQFSKLPRSLTCLSISPIVGLTDKVLEYLPPYISNLNLPDSVSEESISEYFRNPVWEGHPTCLLLPPINK